MSETQRREQFSLSGLLFAMVGFSVAFLSVPYLHAQSRMTPSWTDFVLVVLMFAWCMIPLRQHAARAWWIGFLLFGGLFFSMAYAISDVSIEQATNVGGLLSQNDAVGVLIFIPTMLLATIIVGRAGGHVASAIFTRGYWVTDSSANE